MSMEMQKVWDALRKIYGNNLAAATLVVLVRDGKGGVEYVSVSYPQEQK